MRYRPSGRAVTIALWRAKAKPPLEVVVVTRIAEQVCHVGADLGDLLDSVHQGDTSHTLEHVVEEMWINLALIGIELRLLFAQFHLIQPCLGGYIVLVERENPL